MPVWDYHPTGKKEYSGRINRKGKVQKTGNGGKLSQVGKGATQIRRAEEGVTPVALRAPSVTPSSKPTTPLNDILSPNTPKNHYCLIWYLFHSR